MVVGPPSQVRRFGRLARIPVVRPNRSGAWNLRPAALTRPSAVFRGDMLVGESQGIFSERAAPVGRFLLQKKYFFQVRASDEEGHEYFRKLSGFHPSLRFLYVYGWDGWNEDSYGSHLICRGHIRSHRLPLGLIERSLMKFRVNDSPDDEWPRQREVDAETELMDSAEAHWRKCLLRRGSKTYLFSSIPRPRGVLFTESPKMKSKPQQTRVTVYQASSVELTKRSSSNSLRVEVRRGVELLGTLIMGRGSVQWWPNGHSTTKFERPWKEFVKLLETEIGS